MLNIGIILLVLVGMIIFRYLDGFWEQKRLPYPIALSLFSNAFALTYFISFIWMFGVIGGIIISLLCFFQIVYSAFLWIFLLPNLISTFRSIDNRVIPKVNIIIYGGFSYLVIIVMILTGVNFFISPYKSMLLLVENNIWKLMCVLVIGNMARLIVMSKFLKKGDLQSYSNHDQGDTEVQYKLGKMCEDHGELAEAAKWYRKAAEKGHAEAQYSLGILYSSPEIAFSFDVDIPHDDDNLAEAVKWYRKAAEQGLARAQNNLGEMYEHGDGVRQDWTEAVRWYSKAAEQGLANAQYNLGTMYDLGWGVSQDGVQGAKWNRKAAEQGHAGAQDSLGMAYSFGDGVPQDDAEAVKWYSKAAEQGLARAQNNLGTMYENGRGVSLDYIHAAKCYRMAAEQNFEEAQHNLGKLYSLGHGVPQDYVQALMWFNLAVANTFPSGYDLEENRDELVAKMTTAQIAEAQRLAREWTDKSYASMRKSYREGQKSTLQRAFGRSCRRITKAFSWRRNRPASPETARNRDQKAAQGPGCDVM